jgi:hypothetical protein
VVLALAREGQAIERFVQAKPLVDPVAADFAEIGAAVPKKEAGDIGVMLVTSLALNLGDKTFLRGITDFTQAYSDPKRYFGQWAQGMAGTSVPNIFAQAARMQDPLVREARGMVDGLKARIPGVRESLPAKLDVAGQPIERSLVEPLAASRERDDPLAEAMLELQVFKGAPQRKVRLLKRDIELDGREYEAMKGYVQRDVWETLTPVVESGRFQALMRSDRERAGDELEMRYQRRASLARARWLRENGYIEKARAPPPNTREPSMYSEFIQ